MESKRKMEYTKKDVIDFLLPTGNRPIVQKGKALTGKSDLISSLLDIEIKDTELLIVVDDPDIMGLFKE